MPGYQRIAIRERFRKSGPDTFRSSPPVKGWSNSRGRRRKSRADYTRRTSAQQSGGTDGCCAAIAVARMVSPAVATIILRITLLNYDGKHLAKASSNRGDPLNGSFAEARPHTSLRSFATKPSQCGCRP
jgi:hypothetical protein